MLAGYSKKLSDVVSRSLNVKIFFSLSDFPVNLNNAKGLKLLIMIFICIGKRNSMTTIKDKPSTILDLLWTPQGPQA
jgi:hypothetical protein